MAEIRLIHLSGQSESFTLSKDKTTIGRNKDNDIVLDDHRVSRYHAEVIKKKDHFLIVDLKSANGTFVNQKAVKKNRLEHDDVIAIGNSDLVFSEKESLPSSGPAEEEDSTGPEPSPLDSQILKSSRVDDCVSVAQDFLKTIAVPKGEIQAHLAQAAKKEALPDELKATLHNLEQRNKVLYVLYEISRQMSTTTDFIELLKNIMDQIFQVIDADFGFIVLSEKRKKLNPVVIKYRDEKLKEKEDIKPSRTLLNKVIDDRMALLTSDALADDRFDPTESLISRKIRSAICVPLWRKNDIIGAIQLDSIRLDNQFTEDDLELLKTIGCQIALIIEQANLNEKLREEKQFVERLERYHSPQVAKMILKSIKKKKDKLTEPQDLTVTILFTDIIGFSSFSEHMHPREVSKILNQYFSHMTDIVFRHDGTLDKYLGDGMMAVFGAPLEKQDDAKRAVQAAKTIRAGLEVMVKEAGVKKKFDMRFGINTGRVVAGNLGSEKRMDYTVIGDAVNTASRLEEAAQPNQILIGEQTYELVKDEFDINALGLMSLRGKTDKIHVYEVLD